MLMLDKEMSFYKIPCESVLIHDYGIFCKTGTCMEAKVKFLHGTDFGD